MNLVACEEQQFRIHNLVCSGTEAIGAAKSIQKMFTRRIIQWQSFLALVGYRLFL